MRAARWLRYLVVAGSLGALTALGPGVLHAQIGLAKGTAAPVVTVNDLDGAPYDFSTFVGKKPAYIQFWATWCENCEALLPRLKRAAAKYGSQVEFIGVNVTVNQSQARARRYVEEHQPPFRALWDDKGVSIRAYDVPATSYVVIVDRAGKVFYTGVGPDQDIEAALAKVVVK